MNHLKYFIVLAVLALVLSGCESAEERAKGHFENAISLLEAGDVDRAIVELRNVFDLDGSHLGARRKMAEIQIERGNLRGAYRQYLRLAESDPDDLESRVLLSEMAFQAGNWDELDRHGAQAEELDSENERVRIIALVRDYRAAIDDPVLLRDLARRASSMLEGKPESTLLRNVIMDHSIREQDFEQALAEIDWMIADDPENALYYQERLRVLAMLGDNSAIENQLRKMIEVFPDQPAHKATLVRFYVSRDDLDAAEAVMRDLAAASPPEDAGPTVDLIRFLIEFRDNDTVRAEIEKALNERADPIPFRVIEANLDFSLGKQSEAIATLQDVLATLEPSDQSRNIKVNLARMHLASGNEVGARTSVEEVLEAAPRHPEALKMQAAWQIEADDTDAAIGGLRIVLDQRPQDADAMTLIASAYSRAGRPELYRDFLARAVQASGNAPAETLRYAALLIDRESYLPAEDILLTALRLAPSNTNILVALGQVYLRMEDFGRVRSVVDALRKVGGDYAIQAANRIEADRLNLQQGTDAAMSFLEDLANTSEATLAEKIELVQAKLRTGDVAEALALAKELKDTTPESQSVVAVLAVAHIASGNLEEGEAIYRGMLEDNPVLPRIWLALSRLQLVKGDREAAKSDVNKGLVHLPEDGMLLWAKASFLERDGKIDEAIEIYKALYERGSGSVIVANNLASLLTTYRSDEESLQRAWTIARRFRDADSPPLNDTYGWILHRRGNSADALPYLERAAEGLPRDPVVQYHLGQIYIAVNRPQDALVQFRKAVEIAGPTDTRTQIEEARTLIQSLQNAGTAEN